MSRHDVLPVPGRLRRLALPVWPCPSGPARLALPVWPCPSGPARLALPVWPCPSGPACLALPVWPCLSGPACLALPVRPCLSGPACPALRCPQRNDVVGPLLSIGGRLPPAFVNHIVQHSLDNSSAGAFGAYLESWARTDFSEQVKDNPAAVKVIVGEHDPALSAPVMEQTWLRFYPGAELEVVPNAGHYPMFETPAALAASVEGFLGRE
jgi:pimeloyl-ACP methyl ester carboxylesterase